MENFSSDIEEIEWPSYLPTPFSLEGGSFTVFYRFLTIVDEDPIFGGQGGFAPLDPPAPPAGPPTAAVASAPSAPPPRRAPATGTGGTRSRNWAFTINNYSELDIIGVKELPNTTYVCFGKEVGLEGTPHLQGFVSFSNAKTFRTVKKLLGSTAHVEMATKPPLANRRYCMKQGDFWEQGSLGEQGKRTDLADFMQDALKDPNRWELTVKYPEIMAKYPAFADKIISRARYEQLHMEEVVLFPYQVAILDFMHNGKEWNQPPKRSIIWLWSSESAMGKTTFYQYLAGRFKNDVYITASVWKTQDAILTYDCERIIILDLPRDVGDHIGGIVRVLEELSNRSVINIHKYQGQMKFLDNAHILVTANFPPPRDKMPNRFIEVNCDNPLNDCRVLSDMDMY